MKVLKELWDYRTMIGSLVKKDLNARYKGSVLGFLWTLINPLCQLLIYWFIFGFIFKRNDLPHFEIFLFVGLVPFIFCSSSLVAGAQSIIGSAGLVQKIYFPRMVLPIVTVCGTFVNMLLSFIVVFAMLFITGVGVTPYAAMLPAIMVVEFFFVLGLVFIVSSVCVYFRDLEYILTIVTMMWMYLTPVIYSIKDVPEWLQPAMYANPMTGIIMAYRDALYVPSPTIINGMAEWAAKNDLAFTYVPPDFSPLLISALYALGFMVLGFFLFQKLQRKFAEEL